MVWVCMGIYRPTILCFALFVIWEIENCSYHTLAEGYLQIVISIHDYLKSPSAKHPLRDFGGDANDDLTGLDGKYLYEPTQPFRLVVYIIIPQSHDTVGA